MTPRKDWGAMKYVNREMKIEEIVSSFNLRKINLIPPFQRGSVWNLKTRRKLMVNMIKERPIPAIFLYKEAEGSKFSYNILDGKQRLESLILFIGDKRQGIKINNVKDYFFGRPAATERNFKIDLGDGLKGFSDLDSNLVAHFREYPIATIEVDLDSEDAPVTMDEIVNLFIDINQMGVKVSRFDIVKAIRQDPLFKQVLKLVAVRQVRKKRSVYFKAIKSDFVFVLKRLNLVARLKDPNSRVDRMWERLTEIALFTRTGKHRAPADILKGFIKGDSKNVPLSKAELRRLRKSFKFLRKAYSDSPRLMKSKLATDQPQFYTLITTLLSTDLEERYSQSKLTKKLTTFGKMIDSKSPTARVKEYKELSAKQTTHPSRRDRRQTLQVEAIDAIP